MTTLLYQTDSYLQSFTARVTGVDDQLHGVILDQTAFYPGGGGQPSEFRVAPTRCNSASGDAHQAFRW